MNIWKIGSRWSSEGKADKSIIDVFRRNKVVFAGKDTERILRDVKINDYIAIADGVIIVAIAKVLSSPKKVTEFKIYEKDKNRFDYEDWVIGMKVHVVDLDPNDFVRSRIGTFHRNYKESKKLIEIYDNQSSQFSIEAQTFKIKDESSKNNFLNDSEQVKYTVPIYQRPYSWGEDNIKKFISDIKTSYCDEEGNLINNPIFFGSMQFSEKRYLDLDGFKFEQNVIDGQQRLSTILVLLKVLKLKFPDSHKLNSIQLNWLETQVNNHTQNENLLEFLHIGCLEDLIEKPNNPYIQNAQLINNLFDEFVNEFFPEDGQNEFDIENFVFEHIFKNLFFVVIETKASLSKTLEIFDTINTTGLDLKGTDVFKIRFFEYLKDKKNLPDEIFNEINKLYAKIDKINENETITNMEQILTIYQVFLIGKYELSNQLYTLNVNTFFERLFDTILNITKHPHFNLSENFDLEIKEIDKIIDSRLDFHHKLEKFSPKSRCEYQLILNSRYGRYWIWIILFNLKYGEDNLLMFVSKLNKILSIYSIIYARTVNWVHSKMRELNLKIQKGAQFVEIDNWFNENFFTTEKQINFKGHLEKSIAHNWKWKYIICRTSAMLEDENNPDLFNLLFNQRIDIEHIQSYLDKDKKVREEILNDENWRNEINSIGNLMVLEETINRSIGNNDYPFKQNGYKSSKFRMVKQQFEKYKDHWGLEEVKDRKRYETKKLLKYYFS